MPRSRWALLSQVYWNLLLFSMFLPRRLAGYYWRILFLWLHRNQALSLSRIHWNCRTKSIPRLKIYLNDCDCYLFGFGALIPGLEYFLCFLWGTISCFIFFLKKIMVKKIKKKTSNSVSLLIKNTSESKNITFHYLKIDFKLSKPFLVVKAEAWCLYLIKK